MVEWNFEKNSLDDEFSSPSKSNTDDDEGPDEERYTLNAMAFPFHHGSHYSSPPLVVYYLIRLQPYTDLGINL